MVNWDSNILAHIPLGTEDKLCNPEFPIPICNIYGDKDHVGLLYEDEYGKKVIEANKTKWGDQSKYLIIPGGDHILYKDNPLAYTNAIINCITDENLPLPTLEEQKNEKKE